MQGDFGRAAVFFAGSCAISAALRKRQSFFTEISYKETQPGLKSYGVRDNLKPKETGCIKIYAVVPSNWEQIGIQYTPYFAPNETRNFVLNRANKLN